MGGLVRYVVFFVMKLKTRAVEIAGITRQPDEAWMTQVARNLTDAGDGFRVACSTSSWTETRSTLPPFGACCGQWREATGPACLESNLKTVLLPRVGRNRRSHRRIPSSDDFRVQMNGPLEARIGRRRNRGQSRPRLICRPRSMAPGASTRRSASRCR
jgi:hypothetical protein